MATNLSTNDVYYTLELFPTEGNWNKYMEWLGGTTVLRTNDNAGVDLYCVREQTTGEVGAELLDLGVKARMIKHWITWEYGTSHRVSDTCHFWLAPRSSIWKNNVVQANSMGIIDRSYRGVLMGAVLPIEGTATISPGSRLFQVLAPDMGYISRVVLRPLNELDETVRGEGGFGSTGK